METRELRYFVAVAEELHFGRAATRVGISQPPLSRAIRQLERRLGTMLLDRSDGAVRLTAPGRVLLDEARVVLAAVETAQARVARAAADVRELVLAVRTGAKPLFVRAMLDAYASSSDAVPVRVVLSRTGEQARMVRDGRANVALLHPPLDDTLGLAFEAFCVEGQVAVLPPGHALAARPTITGGELDLLAGVPVHGRTAGRPPASGDEAATGVEDLAGLAQLVALGRACAVLPASVAAQLPHDIAVVPVSDAEPVTMAVAWSEDRAGPDVGRLVAVAHDLRRAYEASAAPRATDDARPAAA